MNKYDSLFKYVVLQNKDELKLAMDEINKILGYPLDHSFLKYKKELITLGYKVDKISLKEKYIIFKRI